MAKKETLEVAVQQPAQPPATLYNMVAYMKALASMEEVPADLEAAFEAECRTALQATADKIDAVHAIMFKFAALARSAEGAAAGYQSAIADELEREQKRASRYVSKLENLRRMIMEVGVMRGLYIGEGDKRKPAPLQGNVATFQFDLMPACIAEEGFDEALVPDEFKTVEFSSSQPLVDWKLPKIQDCIVSVIPWKTVVKVDRKALLAALKEPCPKCNGFQMQQPVGEPFEEDGVLKTNLEDITCPVCGGTGRRKVPGAKLEVGRLKLVVK